MPLLRNGTELEKLDTPEKKFRYIELFLQEIKSYFNGKIGVENQIGRHVSFTFDEADVEKNVRHDLGYTPSYYRIENTSAAMQIYNGASDPNSTFYPLKSSAVGTVTLYIY